MLLAATWLRRIGAQGLEPPCRYHFSISAASSRSFGHPTTWPIHPLQHRISGFHFTFSLPFLYRFCASRTGTLFSHGGERRAEDCPPYPFPAVPQTTQRGASRTCHPAFPGCTPDGAARPSLPPGCTLPLPVLDLIMVFVLRDFGDGGGEPNGAGGFLDLPPQAPRQAEQLGRAEG